MLPTPTPGYLSQQTAVSIPWHKKFPLLAFSLVLAVPVGVVLLWTNPRVPRWVRILVTVLEAPVAFVWLVVVVAIVTGPPKPRTDGLSTAGSGSALVAASAAPMAKPETWDDREPNKVDAWLMAQNFVRRGLKSPSSADFGSVFGEYQRTDDVVDYDPQAKTYDVHGWVDSQNAFGAKLRTRFRVKLVRASKDEWRTVGAVQYAEW